MFILVKFDSHRECRTWSTQKPTNQPKNQPFQKLEAACWLQCMRLFCRQNSSKIKPMKKKYDLVRHKSPSGSVVMGSIPVRDSDFSFVPCSWHTQYNIFLTINTFLSIMFSRVSKDNHHMFNVRCNSNLVKKNTQTIVQYCTKHNFSTPHNQLFTKPVENVLPRSS